MRLGTFTGWTAAVFDAPFMSKPMYSAHYDSSVNGFKVLKTDSDDRPMFSYQHSQGARGFI